MKSRVNFVSELWDNARFFFVAPEDYDPKAVKKRWSAETPAIMGELVALLEAQPSFEAAALEPVVLGWIADKGYHLGNVMNALPLWASARALTCSTSPNSWAATPLSAASARP